MDTSNLKEYLKQAFDIEMAIYTHKNIISDYKQTRVAKRPIEPELNLPEKPMVPAVYQNINKGLIPFWCLNDTAKSNIVSLVCLAVFNFMFATFFGVITCIAFGGCVSHYVNFDFPVFFTLITVILFTVFGFFLSSGVFGVCFSKTLWKKETLKFNAVKAIYETRLEDYRSTSAEVEKVYKEEMKEYSSLIDSYDSETKSHLIQLEKLFQRLIMLREKLYSANIIYPKYRNLIAISTIYEYFASGRCIELTGPTGAYNLYENELHANIIISSLSQIISDLQQIKSGQFALYQELSNSNKVVESLLSSIYDNTHMTAYYTYVTAKAATADRYIIGMVW